jgi:hypothetical protein
MHIVCPYQYFPTKFGSNWPSDFNETNYNASLLTTASKWYLIYQRSGEVHSIQHYVIKFVSDLRQLGGFSPGTRVSSTNITDRHDITEILLKVALNTINQTKQYYVF